MVVSADLLTSADAARLLDVSPRQVRRLVEIGELTEVGRVGGALLVDTESVHRLVRRGRQRGRPWSEHVAWAAVDLLDFGTTASLNASQRSRLKTRLRSMDAAELVRNARGRAEVSRHRATKSLLGHLARTVTLSADSAVAAERAIADTFGLASTTSATVDGYVERSQVDAHREQFHLVPDHRGNVTLRATDHASRTQRVAGVITVALDLAESLDPRLRAAGRDVLDRRLRTL